MPRSLSDVPLIKDEEVKVEDMKLQKIHTKCVPSPERLAEAVQILVGDAGTFKIEMRHSVYNIRCSKEIDMADVVRLLNGPRRSRSNPHLSEIAQPLRVHKQTGRASLEALKGFATQAGNVGSVSARGEQVVNAPVDACG